MTDPYSSGELGLSIEDLMNDDIDYTLDYEQDKPLTDEELNNIELPF